MIPEGPMHDDEPPAKVERRRLSPEYSPTVSAGQIGVMITLVLAIIGGVRSFNQLEARVDLEVAARLAAVNFEAAQREAGALQLRTEESAATASLKDSISALVASQNDIKASLNDLTKEVRTLGQASGRVRQ